MARGRLAASALTSRRGCRRSQFGSECGTVSTLAATRSASCRTKSKGQGLSSGIRIDAGARSSADSSLLMPISKLLEALVLPVVPAIALSHRSSPLAPHPNPAFVEAHTTGCCLAARSSGAICRRTSLGWGSSSCRARMCAVRGWRSLAWRSRRSIACATPRQLTAVDPTSSASRRGTI
jgi:hypothetical protein